MVSLEGVIENDEPPGESGLANATHSRKRKLLKPFKPPTRVSPPLAPAEDAWGPPGREYQRQDAQFPEHGPGAGHEGRGALPPRSSYTGFGQVESLSDGEGEEDGGASLCSVARGAGWEIGAAAEEYRRGKGDHHDEQMGYFAQARSEVVPVIQSSSLAATAPMSGYTWGREDWRASDGAGRSAREINRGEMPPPRSQDLVFYPGAAEGPVHDDDDHRTGESYLENCQNDADGGAWPQSARDSTPGQWNRANGVAPAMSQRQELDHDSARRRDKVEDGQLGGAFVSEVITGHPVPESGSEYGGLRRQEQTRSTQDILSLFGGFGGETPAPSVDESVHVERPRQAQQQAAIPLGSHEPDEASPVKCLRNQGGQDFIQPELCPIAHEPGGEDWAAERRRVQKAAHVEEEGGRGGEAFVVGGVDSALAVDEVAVDESVDEAIDWACDVCGVRGSPPSNVCRVCGNIRQVPGSGGREENGDPPGLPSGGADGSGDAGGVGDIGVDLESIGRDERGRARGNAVHGRQQGVAEENQWHNQGRRRDGGGEVGGDNVGAASGTGRGGVTHLDRFMDDPFDEHVAGTTPQEGREAQLPGTSSAPSRRSLSQAGAGRCNSTSACGGGSTPRAGSDRKNLSVRMLMDLGSSSESDSG